METRKCDCVLIRFSIIKKGGIEIFDYEPRESKLMLDNQTLISGFMTALQMLSETLNNPIQQILFSNMVLYVRTYGDFTLQLLLDERIDDQEINELFERLAKKTLFILDNTDDLAIPDRTLLLQKFIPVLAPLAPERLVGTIQDLTGEKNVSKIALAGLAKAGKTSIKNLFFDNWSRDMISNIKGTIGLDTMNRFNDFLQQQLVIYDFGGQTVYHNQHLSMEERWEKLTALVFVVDIQDDQSFSVAGEYLKQVWQIISRLNKKKTKLSVFLHKYDIDQRNALDSNVSRCLMILKDFADQATFYLTTIEDDSSNIAMIKTLYFSLPETLVKRLLETEFIDHFEGAVLPGYTMVTRDDRYLDEFRKLKTVIHRQSVLVGKNLGLFLQKKWLKSLMGEFEVKSRFLSSRTLEISQKGQSFLIKIPYWESWNVPKELTTTLLDGMLEGIFTTFYLTAPKIVEEGKTHVTWQVDF
ncbi:MAG: ADP-ribosylation factor-like protein [Candidatus Odinarchaeota archaeon]